MRAGGLLPFPRTGCVLVRDASVVRSVQQVKGGADELLPFVPIDLDVVRGAARGDDVGPFVAVEVADNQIRWVGFYPFRGPDASPTLP